MKKKGIVFSAMRPTGRLHLGHWVGALQQWVQLQDEYDCLFAVVDWHALMGEYENPQTIRQYSEEMVWDWLACGLDPSKSVIFVQSDVPQHLELFMILSCLTPLGWLERNPTYKEQLREITTRDLQTYAFLGYPVLQAADILLYKAEWVPIGEDQLPHLELTREITRRFHHLYGEGFFPECQPLLTAQPRLLGLDGRKMSKSYQNAIYLVDDETTVAKKVQQMFTDPQRIRLTDPGRPEVCNVYHYYQTFAPDKAPEVYEWCTQAKRGCTECKRILGCCLNEVLEPLRHNRKQRQKEIASVREILDQGAEKARERAAATITQVKERVLG